MHPPDLKKLITGFLILAAVASSSSFIFSGFYTASSSAVDATGSSTSNASNTSELPDNAFIEELPDSGGVNPDEFDLATLGKASSAPPYDPTNLTDTLAAQMAQALVARNPNGPQIGSDGMTGIEIPDLGSITEQIGYSPAVRSLEMPDWDADVASIPYTVIEDSSIEDAQRYITIINDAFDANFIKPGLLWRLGQRGSPDVALAVTDHIDKSLKTLANLPVPAQAEEFHKSLLRLLVFSRNTMQLADATVDPVKNAFIVQMYEQSYFQAIYSFQDASVALQQLPEFNPSLQAAPEGEPVGFFRSIFGVPKAHAIFFAVVFDPANLARMIWEWIQDMLLQVLKDTLIHRLVQSVIQWAQNGFEGKPSFITDWKGFLTGVGKSIASRFINDIAPGLCRSFGPLVTISLLPVNNVRPIPDYGCTLDRVVTNVRQFYENFRSGGWLGYTSAIEPRNNVFAAMMQVSDDLMMLKKSQQEASKSEGIAGKGFLGTKRCILRGRLASDPCQEYEITTPGDTVATQVSDALGSPVHRIVNAEDFTALVSALVNAAINKLINLGVNGLMGLFRPGNRPAPGQGASGNDPCVGLTGQALTDCRRLAGDVNNSSGGGNIADDKTSLLNNISDYTKAYQDGIQDNTAWLQSATAVRTQLQALARRTSCATAPAARDLTVVLDRIRSAIPGENNTANRNISELNRIRNLVNAATTPQQLADASTALSNLNAQNSLQFAATAADRLSRMNQLKSELTATCPASLTPLE
jgi:hypothetical protein